MGHGDMQALQQGREFNFALAQTCFTCTDGLTEDALSLPQLEHD